MKLTLTKKGGLAAIKHPPHVVDVDALAAQPAAELTRLLQAAKAASAAKDTGRGRDTMSFTVMVDDGTVIRQSDTNMTPEFSELLQALERHGK